MKLYIPIILSAALFGCSTNNYQDELAIEIITEKLAKNGPSLFCDQPGYSACYKISQKRCMLEISESSEECTKKAKDKFANISMNDLDGYSEYYGGCLVIEHVMKYPSTLDEIGSCLESLEVDEDKALRSLLK